MNTAIRKTGRARESLAEMRLRYEQRRGPSHPDVRYALARAIPFIVAGLVMLAVGVILLASGCGEQTYRIAHVEGTGAIVVERCAVDEEGTLSDCADVLDTAWSSAGETVEGAAGPELVHCARLERLVAMGLDIQFLAGVIPGVSDERCEGSRSRPFR